MSFINALKDFLELLGSWHCCRRRNKTDRGSVAAPDSAPKSDLHSSPLFSVETLQLIQDERTADRPSTIAGLQGCRIALELALRDWSSRSIMASTTWRKENFRKFSKSRQMTRIRGKGKGGGAARKTRKGRGKKDAVATPTASFPVRDGVFWHRHPRLETRLRYYYPEQ